MDLQQTLTILDIKPLNSGTSIKLKQMFNNLGDITVRSGLSDFTFNNSKTFSSLNSK